MLRSEDELELLLHLPLEAGATATDNDEGHSRARRHHHHDHHQDHDPAFLCAGNDNDTDDPPPAEGSCDVVLVDAPCSSTGVLRRRPSLRWTLDPPQALMALPEQQRELLAQAQVGGWVNGLWGE